MIVFGIMVSVLFFCVWNHCSRTAVPLRFMCEFTIDTNILSLLGGNRSILVGIHIATICHQLQDLIMNSDNMSSPSIGQPVSVTAFHSQDWLIILAALRAWTDPWSSDGSDFYTPRKIRAYELAATIAREQLNLPEDIPPDQLTAQVDPEWPLSLFESPD